MQALHCTHRYIYVLHRCTPGAPNIFMEAEALEALAETERFFCVFLPFFGPSETVHS